MRIFNLSMCLLVYVSIDLRSICLVLLFLSSPLASSSPRAYLEFQGIVPFVFVEIQEHLIFELVLSVVDNNRVVVSIQAMHQSRDRRTLEMSNITRRLSRLLT